MAKGIDKDILRKRIVESRERKGMNQTQLAERADITSAAISQIEKGLRVPTIPVLRKIANVLEESIDYLTGKTEDSMIQDLLQDEEVMAFFRGFQSLDPADRDTIRKNIEFLHSKYSKGNKK